MNGWRTALKRLHLADGPLTSHEVSLFEDDRKQLMRYGLATMTRRGKEFRYAITARGRMVATGQVEFVPAKRKPGKSCGWKWRNTWTAPIAGVSL